MNETLKQAQNLQNLTDKLLKDRNDPFREAMKDVEDRLNDLKDGAKMKERGIVDLNDQVIFRGRQRKRDSLYQEHVFGSLDTPESSFPSECVSILMVTCIICVSFRYYLYFSY